MSELQDLFEQGNPIPKGVIRCGDHYAQTEYMLIDPYASNYAARFKGFMEGVKHQQAIIDEHTEVIKLQDADLRKYEKQIESLKAQLNNMEACYIEKKKEVEGVQKTNINLEAGLRKNSKNKQKLLGKNIELQKRIDEHKKLTTSIRNEFDLWSDDSEFADVIEAQIENLEALRGES
ncbi:hypothetical protein EJV31_24490 [Salmonella enterica]|nr:hypothetical protein [Salmonella enterica]